MQARRQEALEALGVVALVPRASAAATAPVPSAPDRLDWTELADTVRECRLCRLCETRTQTVFGTGDRGARLMVVGEAPGADEDRQGEPKGHDAGKPAFDRQKQCSRLGSQLLLDGEIGPARLHSVETHGHRR